MLFFMNYKIQWMCRNLKQLYTFCFESHLHNNEADLKFLYKIVMSLYSLPKGGLSWNPGVDLMMYSTQHINRKKASTNKSSVNRAPVTYNKTSNLKQSAISWSNYHTNATFIYKYVT